MNDLSPIKENIKGLPEDHERLIRDKLDVFLVDVRYEIEKVEKIEEAFNSRNYSLYKVFLKQEKGTTIVLCQIVGGTYCETRIIEEAI